MSWDGSLRRWRKTIKGEYFEVYCSALSLSEDRWTKVGSYQAANAWLDAEIRRRAAIPAPQPDEKIAALADVDRRIAFSEDEPEEVERLQSVRKAIEAAKTDRLDALPAADDQLIAEEVELARLVGIDIPDDLDPEVLRHYFSDRKVLADRAKRRKFVEQDRTIGAARERFLDTLRGEQKPQTHYEIVRKLRAIPATVWIDSTPCESIDEATVTRHFKWLSSIKQRPEEHNKRLGFFRRFVVHLWQEALLPTLPRNLKADLHKRKTKSKKIKTYEGVAEFVAELDDLRKAWALLCLNTGSTNADLGSLAWAGSANLGDVLAIEGIDIEVSGVVDLRKKLAVRRRAKTGDQESTPTVTYRLWDATIAALKTIEKRPPLLFLGPAGKPRYYVRWDEAKKKDVKRDDFSQTWKGLRIPIGKLRSVASSTLKNEPIYRPYIDYFLGHAAVTVADKNYAAEADDPFFVVLEFVRTKLGIK
jgi:hypothetical protein